MDLKYVLGGAMMKSEQVFDFQTVIEYAKRHPPNGLVYDQSSLLPDLTGFSLMKELKSRFPRWVSYIPLADAFLGNPSAVGIADLRPMLLKPGQCAVFVHYPAWVDNVRKWCEEIEKRSGGRVTFIIHWRHEVPAR